MERILTAGRRILTTPIPPLPQVSGLATLPVIGSMPETRSVNQADSCEIGLKEYVCARKVVTSPLLAREAGNDVFKLTIILLVCVLRCASRDQDSGTISARLTAETLPQPVEIQIDYRRSKQRQHLAHDETPNDRDSERLA